MALNSAPIVYVIDSQWVDKLRQNNINLLPPITIQLKSASTTSAKLNSLENTPQTKNIYN
jgi:hypothetical protein